MDIQTISKNDDYDNKVWVFKPRRCWGPLNSKLHMILVKEEEGRLHFAYRHRRSYQKLHNRFCHMVYIFEFKELLEFCEENMYHIGGSIFQYILGRFVKNQEVAKERIEEALYSLGSEFHAKFNLSDPGVRLEYLYRENRTFHIALFYHAHNLHQDGDSREALELFKVLLRLDPSDPLGIIYGLELVAIQSKQYGFLIKFHEEFKEKYSLSSHLNMAYSVPLAYKLYQLTCNGDHRAKRITVENLKPENIKNKFIIIDMKDDELETRAENLLMHAILEYPWALYAIIKNNGYEGNFGKFVKGLSSQFKSFVRRTSKMSPPHILHKLVERYAVDTALYWKQAELFNWITNVIDNKTRMNPEIKNEEYLAAVKRYEPIAQLNLYRHFLLQNICRDTYDCESIDRYTFLFPNEFEPINFNFYDPFPPPDSINSYELHSFPDSFYVKLLYRAAGHKNAAPPLGLKGFAQNIWNFVMPFLP